MLGEQGSFLEAVSHKSLYGVQVFEQLFQIYEQRLSKEAERQLRREVWVDMKKHKYDCPGEQLVDVSFKATPMEPTFYLARMYLEAYAFTAFAFGFLIVSLLIGIFRSAHPPTLRCCSTIFLCMSNMDGFLSCSKRSSALPQRHQHYVGMPRQQGGLVWYA